jgi:hypothetical protein
MVFGQASRLTSGCGTICLVRHLIDRINDEPVWLQCPDFGDVLVRRKATERLETTGVIIGCNEICEMHPQLVVALAMEASGRWLLDGAVHALYLTLGPRVVRLGQPVLDIVHFADYAEAHLTRQGGVTFARLLGKLDVPCDFAQDRIVGQNRMDLVRHRSQQVFEELPRRSPASLVEELGDRELTRAVDADEQVEPFDEQQECVAPECDDRCLLGFDQGGGVRGLRPGLQILDRRSLTPLRNRLRVDPKLPA